ncbi:MAG: glycosyltransferase family 39 protein [Desulfobacterales bacterium]
MLKVARQIFAFPIKWRIALIMFAAVLFLSGFSIFKNRQFHFMGGMAEEYFVMGVNLYYYGKLSPKLVGARVFRPPGYPVFIAAILRIWGGMPQDANLLFIPDTLKHVRQAAFRAVCLAQSLLLSLTTVILFQILSRYMRLRNAAVLALLFGCNPYLIILTGLFHYDILHIFLIVASLYSLSRVLATGPDRFDANIILAGLLWGLTTLIRPTSLLLPLFALLMFVIRFRPRWQMILKSWFFFILGFSLIIVPHTVHNYTLTARIIPVNAQSGISFWAGTVKKMARDPNHYRWWELWYSEGMEIYHRVTGSRKYSYSRYVRHIIQLEDEFRKDALRNLQQRPGVYFHNFFVDFVTFNLDINAVFIKIFRAIQNPLVQINKEWLRVGDPQDFYSSSQANAFKYYVNLLSLFGFIGICIAVKQKDKSLLVPGLVYLSFCFAHSLTYMDLMYYYIKIPFLYIFSGYFINAVDRHSIKLPLAGIRVSPAFILNGLLVGIGTWLVLTIIIL